MTERQRYGWFGWKIPIFNPNDPDYCEYGCPICTRARKGSGFARFLQKIELKLTSGGCCWRKARQKRYGVRPDESIRTED